MDGNGPLRGCPTLTPRSFVTAEPALRSQQSGCSPSTDEQQLNSRDVFSIPLKPSHVDSHLPSHPLPLRIGSLTQVTITPWRGGRSADIWRERAMGQGELRGLNPGVWWSPLESLTPLTPAPPPWQSATNPLNKEGIQWTHRSPRAAEELDLTGVLCGEPVTEGDAALWPVSSISLRYPEILTSGLLHAVL